MQDEFCDAHSLCYYMSILDLIFCSIVRPCIYMQLLNTSDIVWYHNLITVLMKC
jgi:hypothetical protein